MSVYYPAPAASSPGSANGGTSDITVALGDSTTALVVTGQTWATASSAVSVSLADHPSGVSAEEASAEGCTAAVGALVAGTGFTIYLNVPYGGVGPYRVAFTGV